MIKLPTKLSNQQIVALYFMSLLCICFVLSTFFLNPLRDKLSALESQYTVENTNMQGIENFSIMHPDTNQYLKEIAQYETDVNYLLPNEKDLGNYVVELQNMANAAGVQLLQIHPSKPINKTNYREMAVEIAVKGDYFKTVNFMSRLEAANRFHKISKVNLQYKNGIIETKMSVLVFSFGVEANGVATPGNVVSKNTSVIK